MSLKLNIPSQTHASITAEDNLTTRSPKMFHVFCSLCGVVISQYEGTLFPLPKPPLSWDYEMNVGMSTAS